ncbi:MAG: phosphate acetyltransferase [Betaproteobacteria bacterium]
MNLIESCMATAKANPVRVVFPDAIDERAILAAQQLARQGWAHPVLLANPFELRRYCKQRGLTLGDVPVIDPQHSPWLDTYVEHYCNHRPGVLPEEASAQMRDPLWFAAMMVAQGDIDLCVAGNLAATAAVLRAGMRVIGLAEGMKTLSSIIFMVSPDGNRVLGFADCGVVPEPTVEQLADIAISAADNYRSVTGNEARVAMLSFSTKGSAKHPSVDAVRQATELARSRRPDLLLDGEFQFDAAIAPSVAAQKAPDSPLQGNANVFVFPSLEAGNIGFKIAQRLGKYAALGPLIQGLRLPMHDLSRGCSTSDMVQTTLLAMQMSRLVAPGSATCVAMKEA